MLNLERLLGTYCLNDNLHFHKKSPSSMEMCCVRIQTFLNWSTRISTTPRSLHNISLLGSFALQFELSTTCNNFNISINLFRAITWLNKAVYKSGLVLQNGLICGCRTIPVSKYSAKKSLISLGVIGDQVFKVGFSEFASIYCSA